MLQSAISRQREVLADASAVQFTRNPDGLLGQVNIAVDRSGGPNHGNIYMVCSLLPATA